MIDFTIQLLANLLFDLPQVIFGAHDNAPGLKKECSLQQIGRGNGRLSMMWNSRL